MMRVVGQGGMPEKAETPTVCLIEHLEAVRTLEDQVGTLMGVIANLTLERILGPEAAALFP
jgi:hypothetical protein